MKGVQCYELFGGIALKNHAFSFFFFFNERLIDYINTSYNLIDTSSTARPRHWLKI